MSNLVRLERWGNTYRAVKFLHAGLGERKQTQRQRRDLSELSEEEKSERFEQSVSRSRTRVRELALCNEWEYFATFTLSDEKQDRFDLKAFVKALGVWIGNYNKKYGVKLKYLIIPEQHKNGAWHAHGLLHNVASDSVVRNMYGYLDIPYYAQRFGYISLSPIKDRNKCATYISKYITKDTAATSAALGSGYHSFYSSRGLEGREFICQGFLDDFECDHYNDFVGTKFLDSQEAGKIANMINGLGGENS